MWELDCEESWVLKNWCFWTVVLEKTLESSLDCREIQPVHPKGDQSWVFIGRTDAEAEAPILWPPHSKSWLTEKDADAGERLRAGGEGDVRGWDGWMASPTQWTWIWVSFGSWWWTGRPVLPQFMGSQRVRHDWATELNRTEAGTFTKLTKCTSNALPQHGVLYLHFPRITLLLWPRSLPRLGFIFLILYIFSTPCPTLPLLSFANKIMF